MKQVVLIGDSIRMAYQATVAGELADVATVWGPDENCGTSQRTRERLREWVLDRKPDLVHYNNGLHDLARDPNEDGVCDRPRVGGNDYLENLRHSIGAIVDCGAKVIFALTTPVNEQWHRRKGFDRLESDVENYNRIASALMKEMGVPVNDLHAFVTATGRDEMLKDDGVHYDEANSAVIGREVARVIREHL